MQKKIPSSKKIGLFRPFFSQKGRKTPKLGLAVVRARAKKSFEGKGAKTSDLRHCPYAEEEDQSFHTFPTSDLFFLLISGLLVYRQKRSQKSSELKISDLVKCGNNKKELHRHIYDESIPHQRNVTIKAQACNCILSNC